LSSSIPLPHQHLRSVLRLEGREAVELMVVVLLLLLVRVLLLLLLLARR